MTYFICEWSSRAEGGEEPDHDIVGPFRSEVDALAFIDEHDMGERAMDGWGGYSGAFVIGPDCVDESAIAYHQRWVAEMADFEDEEVIA